MSTFIMICIATAVIGFALILIQISSYLRDIKTTLVHIHQHTLSFYLKEFKPAKQREYWKDQNGFRHWRKTNNA